MIINIFISKQLFLMITVTLPQPYLKNIVQIRIDHVISDFLQK